MNSFACIDCGDRVDPNSRETLVEITGFIRYRGAKGGANHIIDQRKTGRLLCGHCARRRQMGLAPQQERLV